jgi:hypothetical protein
MATYLTFLKTLAREGEPRRITYLCGDQGVLVELAVDALRRVSGASAANSLSMLADEEDKVWAAVNQHALDSEDRRFLLIRNAQKLQGWDQFEAWLASRQAPNIKVVMVASEKQWPITRFPHARGRLVKSIQGMYVECTLPKSNPTKTASEIIRSWSRLTPEQADYLAVRTGHDLARCKDVCDWLDLLPPVEVTTQMLDILTKSSPAESFVAALSRLNKPMAVAAAQRLSQREVGAAVSGLATNLSDLDRLHRALKKAVFKSSDLQLVRSETARQADMRLDRVIELWDAVKHYDPPAVHRRSELLVLADENRDQTGVLERLVVEW